MKKKTQTLASFFLNMNVKNVTIHRLINMTLKGIYQQKNTKSEKLRETMFPMNLKKRKKRKK